MIKDTASPTVLPAPVEIVERVRVGAPPVERRPWIWCGVFCVLVLALIISTLTTIIRTYTPLPKWDYWAEIMWVRNFYAGTGHLSDIWQQHNEHRIFFPRLFFLLDLFLFRGASVFLLLVMLAMQAANAALFLRPVSRMEDLSRRARVTLSAVILALFFSGLNLENFTWSYQVPFILVQLAVTFALWALAWYAAEPRAIGRLGVCLLSGFVATHTLANGILVWPVLLIAAIGLRLRWRSLLAISVTGMLAAASFFYGYQQTSGHMEAAAMLHQPSRVLNYVCAYLALPVSLLNHWGGVAVGAAILVAVVWQIGWFVVCRPRTSPLLVISIGTAAFVLGTAAITSLGRGGYPEQALRYSTPASWLWVSLICAALCDPRWMPKYRQLTVPCVLTVAITLLAVVILPGHIQETRRALQVYPTFQDVETAFSLGIVYPGAETVLPNVEGNYALVDVLRDHHLSIFARAPEAIGQALASRYHIVSAGRCRGAWESHAVIQGFRSVDSSVSGWAWDAVRNQHPRRVLIADASQVIRGLAQFNRQRTDVAGAFHNSDLEASGWFGYMNGINTAGYRAYAVLSDGQSVCPLSNRSEIPSTVAAVYRGGTWSIDSKHSRTWDPGDRTIAFGLPGDFPVVGDWDGTGVWRIGVFRQGMWYLDWNNSGNPNAARKFSFGLPGDIPVVGDWGHTGVSKFGVFRKGIWVLDWNGNREYDRTDRKFAFGLPGDVPVVGDWDGTGVVRVGVFRKGTWFLDLRGRFEADGRETTVAFGVEGDQPLVGDWNGWGVTRLGVYRNGQWIMRPTGIGEPASEETFASFGWPGDIAVPIPGKK